MKVVSLGDNWICLVGCPFSEVTIARPLITDKNAFFCFDKNKRGNRLTHGQRCPSSTHAKGRGIL